MNIQLPLDQLSETQQFVAYITTRQQILDQRAIFSDATHNFRIPPEPKMNEVTKVRIRTGKDNVDEVYLCFEGKRIKIDIESSDQYFDYYAGEIVADKPCIQYYFEINVGKLRCYFNKKGVSREPDHYFDFKIVPDFKTPDWAKGAIMYQIFTDRFFNGDTMNDVVDNEYKYVGKLSKKITNWDQNPNSDGIREFYGGDLQGIMDKMDYLSDLGVEAIYLNPIFVSPSNHKYDTQDYDYVDPHYGKIIVDGGDVLSEENSENNHATKYITRVTRKENLDASNALFADLVDKAHSKGIKVILDGVFNHCGSFNKWLDREKFYENAKGYETGAFTSEESPYNSFFYFHNKDAWPDNPNYDGWWGYDTLPKLNYEGSEKLYNYILDVAKKWVSPPYNADGWRLDVAADLGYTEEFNHQFWRDFRKAVKEANPEAIILAEHYGDPSGWIQGDQWDTVMNYDAFMEPITWFLTGMEKHSDEYRGDLIGNPRAFFDAMTYNMARFHCQSLQVSMNELSNHDHSRFLTRTNSRVGRIHTVGHESANYGINKGIMKEAVVIQMTWPGAPTIYYGDEVGVCGWTDPDNRRTYPWGNEDLDLLNFHKAIIRIRKSHEVLKTGSIKFLHGEHNIISYGRFDTEDAFVVAINNGSDERKITIPVWEIGICGNNRVMEMISTNIYSYSIDSIEHAVENGRLTINMKGYSSIVLKKVKA